MTDQNPFEVFELDGNLYNILFGRSPHDDTIVHGLGLKRREIPRYRDAYVKLEPPSVVIHCRLGGGNRPVYEPFWQRIRQHPLYLSDSDSPIDDTYANIYFRIPDEMLEVFSALAISEFNHPESKWDRVEDIVKGRQTAAEPGALAELQQKLKKLAEG